MNKENLKQFFTFRYFIEGEQVVNTIITEKYNNSFSDKCKYLKVLMSNAVNTKLKKNEKVGCFLSGGLDSSIVCSILAKKTKNLHTFSLDFGETEYINKVVKHLKIKNHHCYDFKEEDALPYLEKMVSILPYPIGDPGILPYFYLAEKVKEHKITKVFNGEGADEVFCGYDKYKMFKYGKFLKHFAWFDFGNNILKRLKAMRGKKDYDAFVEIIRLFDDVELKKLGIRKYSAEHLWKKKHKDRVTNAQEFDLLTSVPFDFAHKGTVSKHFGVTQIAPFLNQDVVNFAFSLPPKYKLKFWDEKHILKQAYSRVLPIEVIKRPKQGLPTPIDKWFKGSLGDALEVYLKKSNHGMYKKNYVFELLEKVRNSKSGYKEIFLDAQKLYAILVLEIFIKCHGIKK